MYSEIGAFSFFYHFKLILSFQLVTRTNPMDKRKAQVFTIRHTRSATTYNHLWENLHLRCKSLDDCYCPFTFRGSSSCGE